MTVKKGGKKRKCGGGGARGSAEKECRDKMYQWLQNHFFIFPIA